MKGILQEARVHWWQYLAHFFLEWEKFQTKVAEKPKRLIWCLKTFFFFENLAVLYSVENTVQSGRPLENMTHALYMLDSLSGQHILIKVILNFLHCSKGCTTLHAHCLSWSFDKMKSILSRTKELEAEVMYIMRCFRTFIAYQTC